MDRPESAKEGKFDTPRKLKADVESNPADDFKHFLLVCMWDKRITKHQLILMDLVKNVKLLTRAVEAGQVPLKKAIQALTGLQNLYNRLMNYLYDDSKYILNQLVEPIKDGNKEGAAGG